MQHLEEGTIHAWLDGALDETEAARVARHAAECESCAAMVAEARGFIAGASRIVSALDVVRGGVIPPSAAGGQPRDQLATRRRSLWTVLRLTPARAAIAATVLVAVGSMLSVRQIGRRDVALESRAAADRSASTTEQVPVAAPAVMSVKADSVSAVASSRDLPRERSGAPVVANSVRVKQVGPARQALEKQSLAATAANEGAREAASIDAAKMREARFGSQAAGAPKPAPAPSAPAPAVGRVAGLAASATRDQRTLGDTVAYRLRDSLVSARRAPGDLAAALVKRTDSLGRPLRLEAAAQTRSSLLPKAEANADSASAAEGCYTILSPIPTWASIARDFALDRAAIADSAPERRIVRSVSGARLGAAIRGASWRTVSARGVEVTWAGATSSVVLTMQQSRAPMVATISDAAHSESITLSRGTCSPR